MKKQMTHRERVEAVLNLEVPDTVPTGDGLFQHWGLVNHFYETKEKNIWTLDELLCAIGNSNIDFAFDPVPSLEPHLEERYGLLYQSSDWTEFIIKRPFNTVEQANRWVKNMIIEIKNSNLESMWSFAGNTGQWGTGQGNYREGFLKKLELLKGKVLFHYGSPACLDICYMMLGMEMFSYMMADDYSLLIEFFDELCKHEIKRINLVADYALSPVTCVYCDIASKTGLMFSEKFLKDEFFPRLKKMNDEWHNHNIKVIYHSEGEVTSVLPDLINSGVDGINPLEPDILDIKKLRIKYPDLIFWGGIDNNELLCAGSVEEVENAVISLIKDAGSSGRLLLGSSGQIHPANKLENILAMFNAARKYGQYL